MIAQTMAVNTVSRDAMASVGLTYVRSFTAEYGDVVEGHEHGEVEYALTREDWLAGRPDGSAGVRSGQRPGVQARLTPS